MNNIEAYAKREMKIVSGHQRHANGLANDNVTVVFVMFYDVDNIDNNYFVVDYHDKRDEKIEDNKQARFDDFESAWEQYRKWTLIK